MWRVVVADQKSLTDELTIIFNQKAHTLPPRSVPHWRIISCTDLPPNRPHCSYELSPGKVQVRDIPAYNDRHSTISAPGSDGSAGFIAVVWRRNS